jgi:hypothetical protein
MFREQGSKLLLLPESLMLLSFGSVEELFHLKRARDVTADGRLHPAARRVAGSCCGARGTYRLRGPDQAARRRLPGTPAKHNMKVESLENYRCKLVLVNWHDNKLQEFQHN